MNYLLFNKEIVISDGQNVRHLEKADAVPILESIDNAHLCVVDIDVLIATSVEFPIEKKDSALVRKFKEFYQHEAYIIQDERIDSNLFQIIGIKEQKVREVYSLIPPQKVGSFIPYAVALRNTLIRENIDLNKPVVFVDDCGNERLVTVFDGLKFSRTRVIANDGEDILPEIKRSQIDFFKKTEEFLSKKSADFVIVVNNQATAATLAQNKDRPQVECLNVAYPALEGLKEVHTSIKYRLPEEDLKKQRDRQLRNKIKTLIVSLCLVVVGMLYFLFNRVQWKVVNNQGDSTRQAEEHLSEQLKELDKATYHQDLKTHKSLNYGIFYLSLLDIIPSSYTVDSFKFYKTSQWHIDITLFSDDSGLFDPIPHIKILKNADIKDIFVNNQPGKHLSITL